MDREEGSGFGAAFEGKADMVEAFEFIRIGNFVLNNVTSHGTTANLGIDGDGAEYAECFDLE